MNLVRLAVTVTCTLGHKSQAHDWSYPFVLASVIDSEIGTWPNVRHSLTASSKNFLSELIFFWLELLSWEPGDILERHRLKNKAELGWEREMRNGELECWRHALGPDTSCVWNQWWFQTFRKYGIIFFARLVWVEFPTFETQRVMINTEDYLFV